jgi:tryptophanyl-tRNA synthetase
MRCGGSFSPSSPIPAPGEPKDIEGPALFPLYQAFASPEESAWMRAAFAAGIAWGELKEALFERIEATVAPMRSRYQSLIADPAAIELRLQEGAVKARAIARPFLAELREAAGLRRLAG